jgi:hypothetical protein
MENPSLEAIHRLWWRAFDRVCYCMVFNRLSVHDRIFGPEPPTPADLKREADHERLVRVFPVVGETIEPIKLMPGRNRDLGLDLHYRTALKTPAFPQKFRATVGDQKRRASTTNTGSMPVLISDGTQQSRYWLI